MIYNFHGSYNPEDRRIFQKAQEDDLDRICKYFQTESGKLRMITFEVFDTREGKQIHDPHHSISRASARYKEMTIYRYWLYEEDPHFPHEITHLIAHTWAKPYLWEVELDTWDDRKINKTIEMVSTSFMQEGLAIAVDDIAFGRKLLEVGELNYIDDWCKNQLNLMPGSLSQVINIAGFGNFPNKIVVPFAASFSKFLLNSGIDKYRQMYISLREIDSTEVNVTHIEKVYKKSEKELLNEWRNNLLND